MTPPGPYETLASLARSQRELVAEERFAELTAVQDAWAELAASLPAAPPPEARAELEDAERTLASATALLETALDSVRGELAGLRRGRSVRSSYAGGARSSSVDAQG